jgi:hypothetical protein
MDKSAFNSEAHKQQLSRIKNGAAAILLRHMNGGRLKADLIGLCP